MSFVLHVAGEQWRANTYGVRDAVRDAVGPGQGDLVPVAKGNGYGLGNSRLAREATRLGVGTLAVGTVAELADVAADFAGDLLVLGPYEPADVFAATEWAATAAGEHAARVVRTVSSPAAVAAAVAGASPARPVRVVLEGLTSMRRFGLEPGQLASALADSAFRVAVASGALKLEGLALHLPLAQPDPPHRNDPGARWHDAAVEPAAPAGATARVQEVLTWAHLWTRLLADLPSSDPDSNATGTGPDPLATNASAERGADGVTPMQAGEAEDGGAVGQAPPAGAEPVASAELSTAPTIWVSHLDDHELRVVRTALPDVPLQVRIGTRLWLGARSTLVARGTVLAVHRARRGEHSGYQQRRALRDGALLVVGGGTAHGVALEAPSPARSVRQRVVAAGTGVLEAGGWALSPFTVEGRQRWFAEPPHMQVSLVQVPAGVPLPAVGDEVECDVRLTTAVFDQVVGLD